MTMKNDFAMKKVDYILIVNKDFEIVYNSRYDSKMGNKPLPSDENNFFAIYPSRLIAINNVTFLIVSLLLCISIT